LRSQARLGQPVRSKLYRTYGYQRGTDTLLVFQDTASGKNRCLSNDRQKRMAVPGFLETCLSRCGGAGIFYSLCGSLVSRQHPASSRQRKSSGYCSSALPLSSPEKKNSIWLTAEITSTEVPIPIGPSTTKCRRHIATRVLLPL